MGARYLRCNVISRRTEMATRVTWPRQSRSFVGGVSRELRGREIHDLRPVTGGLSRRQRLFPTSRQTWSPSRSFATGTHRGESSDKDGAASAPATSQHDSKATAWVTAGFVAAVLAVAWTQTRPALNAEAHLSTEPSSYVETLPYSAIVSRTEAPSRGKSFRMDEIRQHGAESERPWVIWGTGVYDITDWIDSHPGGRIILRAAGSSVEPYWNIFTIHKNDDVYQILEQYRIGDVDARDLKDGQVPLDAVDDLFKDEPARDPRLIMLTERPCNAETPPSALSSFITENPLFYVRHHLWVPRIDPSLHQITIDLGDGSDEKTYTLSDLRTKFPQHTITGVLQCSGNRRKHMCEGSGRDALGLKWGTGAISNAKWRGPLLRDILRDAGLDLEEAATGELRHAQFMGEDAYGASIPLDKAIDPRGDVLLACDMNDEELPRDHGYPVRVFVPGIAGARSVKWVNRITLSDEESTSQWQRSDYKCFGPNQTRDTIDWSKAVAIQETPVQSAITSLRRAASNPAGPLLVEGYAFSGGGRKIVRVDVSVDNGKTWDQARLEPDQALGNKAWSWTRWTYKCDSQPPPDSHVVVKAVDESYNVQPDTHGPAFNFRGNLANAWHRVRIDEATVE